MSVETTRKQPTKRSSANGKALPASHYKKAFLEFYAELYVIGKAATAAGIARRTVYDWLESDAAFKIDFEYAKKGVTEMLEKEGIRRAYEGVEEPVFYKGEQVSVVKKYSDLLLIFMLKANDPAKYRERYELSGSGGGAVEVDIDPKGKLLSALNRLSDRIGATEGNKQANGN